MRTVMRIIGFRPGTGGSSGVGFLKQALDLTFFPELFEVRTVVGPARCVFGSSPIRGDWQADRQRGLRWVAVSCRPGAAFPSSGSSQERRVGTEWVITCRFG